MLPKIVLFCLVYLFISTIKNHSVYQSAVLLKDELI